MKSDKDMIVIDNVSKKFFFPNENANSLKGLFVNLLTGKMGGSEFWALKNVSFNIKEGEFFGIIGRNGSGKSTLLKTLAGIYNPTEGKININGSVSPFLELGVGFNPELTGWENVYLNGTILGLSKKEIDDKIPEILEFSELEPFMNQKLKNFSSGMQVRLAFSVAIHAHSEILFVDEVLAVGDLNFVSKCLNVFRKLKKEGKTIVFVSHGMDSIREFCDRVALMDKGKLLAVGDPETMIYRYEELNLRDLNKGRKGLKSTKGIQIKDVRVLSGGKEALMIESGKNVLIEVALDNKDKKIKEVAAAITITHDGITRVADINSFREKKPLSISDGKIKLELKSPNLLPGKYTISVGLYPVEGGQPYDFVMDYITFEIRGKSEIQGIVGIDHKWQ